MTREPLFTPPFVRLWIFGFVTFFSAFQLFPTIPFRIMSLGGTKSEAGMFLAIYTYACAFAAPITGTIADHIGRKRVLMTAAILFVFFSLLYAAPMSLSLLLLVACVHGVCWSGILSSSSALISETIPASRRTEGMAYWGLSSTMAVSIAPFVGLAFFRYGWTALCIELSILSIGMFFLALRVHELPRTAAREFPALRNIIDWRVTVTAMSLFVISFGYGAVTSYVAVLASERHLEPRSLFFSVFAVTIIISRILTSNAGDRFGPLKVLYPSLALVPVALVILAHSHSLVTLSTAAVLYGIGFGGAYPAFMSFILDRTNSERRAATFGSVLWAFDTGIGTGSLASGFIIDHQGFTTAFVVCAIVGALSLPLFLGTSRLLRAQA